MSRFLRISSGELTAELSPFGAALARVWLVGHDTSLVLGLPEPEDYADAPGAMGVIVGPIAGRVSGARTKISGHMYQMEANTAPDCLHSGSGGVQNQRWEVVSKAEDRVTLAVTLPDGACGLPGIRHMQADYVTQGTELTLTISTTSNKTTLINATSHAYWALDAGGSLDTHKLTIPRPRICETGLDLIPSGKLLDTTAGPYDFTSERCPVAGPPLDDCFALRDRRSDHLLDVLRLRSQMSGVSLRVSSNQPGVVVYAAENLEKLDAPQGTPPIAPFSALAIEAQGWPDSANQPNFPSILLHAGDTTRQITKFSLQLP